MNQSVLNPFSLLVIVAIPLAVAIVFWSAFRIYSRTRDLSARFGAIAIEPREYRVQINAVKKLLDVAQSSLNSFRASPYFAGPTVSPLKYDTLQETYIVLRAAIIKGSSSVVLSLSDARNLYWDEPESELERKALDDAWALFWELNKHKVAASESKSSSL